MYPEFTDLKIILAKVLKELAPFKENIEIANEIEMFFRANMKKTTDRRGAYLIAQMQQGKTSAALLSFLKFISISVGKDCVHLKNVLFLYIINMADVELLRRTKEDVEILINIFNKVVHEINKKRQLKGDVNFLLHLNLLDTKSFDYKEDYINIFVGHGGGDAIQNSLASVLKKHDPKFFIVDDECHFGINQDGRYDSLLKVLDLDFSILGESLKNNPNVTLLSMSATPFSTVLSDLDSDGNEWQVFCLDQSPDYFSLKILRDNNKINHLKYKFAFNLFEFEFNNNSFSVKLCSEVRDFLTDNSLDVLTIWTDNAEDIKSYYRKHKEIFENECIKACGKKTFEPIKIFKTYQRFNQFIKKNAAIPNKKKYLLIFDSFSSIYKTRALRKLNQIGWSVESIDHTKNQVNDWFIDMLKSWESQGNSSYMVIRESQDNIVKIKLALDDIGIEYEVYEADNPDSVKIGEFLKAIQRVPPPNSKKVLFIKQSMRAGQTFGTCENIEYWIESDSTLSANSTDDVTVQSIGRLCGYGPDKGKTEIYCDISKVQIFINFFTKGPGLDSDFLLMPRDKKTTFRKVDINYVNKINIPSTRYSSSGQINNKFRLSIKYILSYEDFKLLKKYVQELLIFNPKQGLKKGLSGKVINLIASKLGVLTDQLDNPLLDYYDNPRSSSLISSDNNLTRTFHNAAKRDLPESLNDFIYNNNMNLDFGNVCGIRINGDRKGNPDKVLNIQKSLDDLLENLELNILNISNVHSNLNHLEIGACPQGGKQILTYDATNKNFQPKIKLMVAKLKLQLKNLKLNQKYAREVNGTDGIVFLLEVVTKTTHVSATFSNNPIHQGKQP